MPFTSALTNFLFFMTYKICKIIHNSRWSNQNFVVDLFMRCASRVLQQKRICACMSAAGRLYSDRTILVYKCIL